MSEFIDDFEEAMRREIEQSQTNGKRRGIIPSAEEVEAVVTRLNLIGQTMCAGCGKDTDDERTTYLRYQLYDPWRGGLVREAECGFAFCEACTMDENGMLTTFLVSLYHVRNHHPAPPKRSNEAGAGA